MGSGHREGWVGLDFFFLGGGIGRSERTLEGGAPVR